MTSRDIESQSPVFDPEYIVKVSLCCLVTLLVNLGLGILLLGAASLLAPQGLSGARAAAPAAPLEAQEIPAGLFFRGDAIASTAFKVPVLHSDVFIDVNGPVVRARVRQQFVNPSRVWLEGIYVFPLPERSAVDRRTMLIGERRVEGEILEKAEAEKVYRQAAREGRRASLLTGKRPNVFVTSVANIGPGETVVIEIEYQDKVELRDGRFELRFPMVVAPRYTPPDNLTSAGPPSGPTGGPRPQPIDLGRREGLGRDAFGPVQDRGAKPDNPLLLRVRLDAGLPLDAIESLYHPVAIQAAPDEAEARLITLAEGPVPADRDFVLTWRPSLESAPEATVFAEQVAGDSYLLVTLLPPWVSPGDLVRPARDLTFFVDTSGSMHGTSLAQAKAAVTKVLDRLRPGDRFNVIQFNSETHALYSGLRPFDEVSRRRAKAYVGALASTGGTNMRPALLRGLAEESDPDRLRQIVFLTDGGVSNESQLFELIAGLLGDARLFTVGIGTAPNSYFMRRAAEVGRGSFIHIGDTGEVEDQMTGLFRKLESPMLTHLRIDWPGDSAATEIYPDPVPDLYAGEPVTFTARIPQTGLGSLSGEIRISGRHAGAIWSRRLPLSGLAPTPGIAAVWARSKIVDLKDRQLAGAERDAVKKAIVEVALAHRLVTAHTSLVAVDEQTARPEEAEMASAEVPRNLPEGWDFEKVFGDIAPTLERIELPSSMIRKAKADARGISLPQTATGSELKALIGMLLALAGGPLILLLRRGRSDRCDHAA